MAISQNTRHGKLSTPAGKDVLSLVRFDAVEGVSELFDYVVEAVSERSEIDFNALLGNNCTVSLDTIDNSRYGVRHFDGILVEANWYGADTRHYFYKLRLRPWLWLLSKRENSLIFHEMTAPDIIAAVLSEHGGIGQFEQRLSKSYPTLEYTVQYRESDLDFVLRLMERHGIGYFFTHEPGSHKLVLFDSANAYEEAPDGKRVYRPQTGQYLREEEHFSHWLPERQFTTGKVALRDYDFKKPDSDQNAEATGDAEYAHGKLESYDYPGKYVEKGTGQNHAQIRMDMARAKDETSSGSGDVLSLAPGMAVSLSEHPSGKLNKKYLALRCTHSYQAESYVTGSPGAGEALYNGSYEFMSAQKPYAPEVRTRIPFVQGPQTAVVVGEGEIDCDEHGRILVRFHWDRKNDKSMRCRVSQVWAGKKWGGIFIPRVGMEVIVDFIEGDPDRPIVTGAVYNGKNKPPFDLPGDKNINGWKSNSTVGGGGYNEFVFDDTKGNELIRTHAQYDMETKVLHDERRDVDNDRTTNIGHDDTESIGNNRTGDVGVNDTLNVGNELFVEAGSKITLKCGSSTIVMEPMSIKITSPTVEILSSMTFKSTAGMTSEHKAGALFDIKGTLVKINS